MCLLATVAPKTLIVVQLLTFKENMFSNTPDHLPEMIGLIY